MRRSIPKLLQKQIREKARLHCEYCLAYEPFSFSKFQFDHIISLKHGGATNSDNLCLSCIFCNQNKGSDIGTILLPSEKFIRFFNPRKDNWNEHFEITETFIHSRSAIGEATIKILDFNHIYRLLERMALLESGLFPHSDAPPFI